MKLMMKLSVLGVLSIAGAAQALEGVEFGGSGYIRHESKKNPNYIENNNDGINVTQMRASIFAKKTLEDNYGYLYFAPIFSKIAGQSELVPSSTTANTDTATSGGSQNSRVDMLEAYIALNPMQDSKTTLFLGRQVLSYGDDLIIGASGWTRTGRSFDGFKAQYNAEKWKVDLLAFTTSEKNSTSTTSAPRIDSSLYGAYFTMNVNDYMKAADLYYLRKDNASNLSSDDINAFGARFKSTLGSTKFDYRAEAILQRGNLDTSGEKQDKSEHQWDAEVGYTTGFYATRFGVEAFYSTKFYDAFYPTGHRYLGYVDQLSRKNINGYVAHLSSKPTEKLSVNFDYHIFKRTDKSVGAYDFSGASLGTAGTKDDVGTEYDLTLAYQLSSQLTFSAGYGRFVPGDYIKDQGTTKDDSVNFGYLQLSAKI